MTGKIIGLYGAGGFAKELIPFLKTQYMPDLCLIDDAASAASLLGVDILTPEAFSALTATDKRFNVAIASPEIRARIATELVAKGYKAEALKAPQAIVYDGAEIGEGTILCAHTMVMATAKIGRFFQCNIYSYVEHDCVIGDFVTFSPRVSCNGAVHIGDRVFVGSGAVIRNGSLAKPLTIGEGAVIGMGAVVTKDVPPHTTVVGNPARILEKR